MAYYNSRETAVMSRSTAEYARVTSVSPEFFRVLAIAPILGRLFTAEEMKSGTSGAVLLSYAYWQSHFGGDPGAVGQAIRVSGPQPIVGVLPPGFGFPKKTDLWVPWINGEVPPPRGWHSFLAIARLKPGVSLEQAQTEMSLIARLIWSVVTENGRMIVSHDGSVKGFNACLINYPEEDVAAAIIYNAVGPPTCTEAKTLANFFLSVPGSSQ